jgi:hypothetical protein
MYYLLLDRSDERGAKPLRIQHLGVCLYMYALMEINMSKEIWVLTTRRKK